MRRFLFLAALVAVVLSDYVHMPDPCPESEVCPGHPDAICKKDCLIVLFDVLGRDCIYHFYNAKGDQLDCYM